MLLTHHVGLDPIKVVPPRSGLRTDIWHENIRKEVFIPQSRLKLVSQSLGSHPEMHVSKVSSQRLVVPDISLIGNLQLPFLDLGFKRDNKHLFFSQIFVINGHDLFQDNFFDFCDLQTPAIH